MDGNISVDNLLTLKEFVMKIDPSSIDGFQKVPFLENLNLLVLPLKSDPRYEDSDGDDLDDKADKFPLAYTLNAKFAQNIMALEKLAISYIASNGNCTNKDIPWLVSMFIRQFNSGYTSKLWNQTAGAIDYGFVDYVKNSNNVLYNYFSECKSIKSGNTDGDVDVQHMSATMCVLLYESTFEDGFQAGAMFEVVIDSLGGWAGDLQTLMVDVKRSMENDLEVNDTFKMKMQNSLGSDKQSFSMMDMYADTDAKNINNLMENYGVADAFTRYYTYGYRKRFTSFIGDYSISHFRSSVRAFTNAKFANLIGWPLLDNLDFTEEESDQACEVFMKFIVNRRNLE